MIKVKPDMQKTSGQKHTKHRWRMIAWLGLAIFPMNWYIAVCPTKGYILIKMKKVSPKIQPTESLLNSPGQHRNTQQKLSQYLSGANETTRNSIMITSGALDSISWPMTFRTCGAPDRISWLMGTHTTCAPCHRMCRRWWLPCSCGWCVLVGRRCGRGYHRTGLPVSLKPELFLDSYGLHDQRHCTGCKPGRSCTPELCAQVDGSCCRPVHWCSQQRCGLA